MGPRVLTALSAAGRIVRASNNGGWTTSRPRWASTESCLGEEIAPRPEAERVAALVERWLRVFGLGTAADLKWWLGSTVSPVRKALANLHAVEVDLDGQIGYLLPDDLEPTAPVDPWAVLLPPLDPTTMGWTAEAGISGRTRPTSSTRAATPDPPPGGTVGSWAAGARATRAKSSCRWSRTRARKVGVPSSMKRRA